MAMPFMRISIKYQNMIFFLISKSRYDNVGGILKVKLIFTLALKCCKDLPDERPKMAEVAKELEYICSMLLEPDSKGDEYVTSDSSSTIFRDVSGSDIVSGSVPTIKPR
ncbi:hypothetical protein PHAVU_008G246700 [Phaseolus vulgaris]|uniref:Uncharacterized protein n=1 Tax=Phaseolus vulgaris TaxID=3885 RepID=V7BC33_PHAVU|nr:hypothetical protein PHAVU_008G246700g [Phaseolus vulgaris]ESW14026.1 hypothetical protein PHAVU_008G246700g [Phaseolus vulgaris]